MIDESEAIETVKRYITDHGGQADRGSYRATREGDGWFVGVEWTPHVSGGHVLFEIDAEGRVVRYHPGR